MPDCMTFPDDIIQFIDEYSFKDEDEVYTNGSELIQVFRVKQAIEHYFAYPSGWIDVRDRLPDRLDEYLVVNCGKVGLAIYHDGLWFAPTRKVEITHWMPLPEPPKMEGSETDD